jgi:hypothetical protein
MSKRKDESNWAYGGVRRRDERHTHEGQEVPTHNKKKNTKRWCKGKVGREHKFELVQQRFWTLHKCSVCGKQEWR